jgi:LysM repeat protein
MSISIASSAPQATRAQRLQELHQHPAAPPGLEVHAGGLRHEVQKGDSAWAVARDYSQAYHMDISPTDVMRANAGVFAGGLQPGELLVVPGVQERFDAFIEAQGTETPELHHTVRRGDTLSSIARQFASRTADGTLTWQQLHAANRDVLGSNPNVILPGQQLTIPGTGSDGYVVPKTQTLSQLDQDVVLTRVGRVRHESGGIEQLDIVRYRADGSHAEHHSSIDAAVRAARAALSDGEARSNPIAIVQARDGAWTMPVRGEEVSDNLDDSDRTLSLAWRAGEREVVAVVEQPWEAPVRVRRFDR